MPDLVDRRRSPRLHVHDRCQLPACIRDISLGGLALERDEPLAVNAIEDFPLTLGDESTMVLRGRVAHVRAESRPGGRTVYVLGVQFLEDVTDRFVPESARLAS